MCQLSRVSKHLMLRRGMSGFFAELFLACSIENFSGEPFCAVSENIACWR